MAIPEEIISEIKYRYDIESAISPYVNLKRRGKNLVGLCPFHNEKTPSFTVYPENGSFYCFGCGVGGDVFTFTGLIENLDYIESVKLLADKAGVTLPQDGYDDSMQKLRAKIYDINKETARFFHNYMMSEEGKWGLDYFLNRGLSLKTIKHFGLGAAPDSWDALINHLKSKGFTIGEMMSANVIGKSQRGSYYDRFRHRVMFPIINIRGNIIGFSGRAMPGEDKMGGKYVNTSDTPVYKKSENLFAMNFAKNNCAERIVLVEGNMDVIALHQAGITNAVAALGTSFTAEQVNLISRYTKEIVIIMDADAAGQKAVRRAFEMLKNSGLNVKVVSVPEGKDPDEFIKKHGADKFRYLLEGAVSDIDYKLLAAAEGINTNEDSGRIEYLSRAIAIIADCNDSITREVYIGRICEKYGVSRTTVNARVSELRKSNAKKAEKKIINDAISPKFNAGDINPDRRLSPRAAKAEEGVIAVLLQHPDFFSVAKEQLPPDKMITSLNRRIYEIIYETLDAGGEIEISVFGQRLLPAELGFVVALQNSERAANNPKMVLNDCIAVILEESMLKSSDSSGDSSVEDWAKKMQSLIDKKK